MPSLQKLPRHTAERKESAVLVIACGALAREFTQLIRSHGWEHLHMQCIDARLHLRPALIPERLRDKIRQNKGKYEQIFVA